MTKKKSEKEIIGHVLSRIEYKNEIYKTRRNVLDFQSEVMRQLVHITSSAAKVLGNDGAYATGIPHKLVNLLQGSKLAPTYIGFKHEQSKASESARVLANNLSYVHSLMRKKGEWEEANIGGGVVSPLGAVGDLIRGESWIRRYIKKNNNGDAVGIAYEHVPFEQIRGYYGDFDVIRVSELTKDQAIKLFGEKTVNKVQKTTLWSDSYENKINENSTISNQKQSENKYGYIHYVNSSSKEEYEILGSDIISNYSGEKYRYVYDNGETYDPFNRRTFYSAIEEQNFGYGVLDLILPLARLDDTFGNVSVKRMINDVDPLTIVSHDDPDELKKKFRQHISNRSANNVGTPFFVKSNINTLSRVDKIDQKGDVGIYKFLSEFIIDRVSMLTDMNLRAMIEFAPTDGQDQRRQDLQDKVNLGVLLRNKASDSKFAKEDIAFLKEYDTMFHDKTLYLERSYEDIGMNKEDAKEQDLLIDGELPTENISVREFMSRIDDFDFDITPRLDGVLDDQTRFEILAQRSDINLLPIGSKAHAKGVVDYFGKTNPRLKIDETDIMPEPLQPQV